jgi:hypothetical protein
MTIETITFQGVTYEQPSLGSYSGPELVKIYNAAAKAVGGTETKRFGDKAAALKRTWEVLRKTAEAAPEATVATAPSELKKVVEAKPEPTPEPEAPKAEKVVKEKKDRPARGMYFMFPHRAQDVQKMPKKGSMRAKLFSLLSREYGATFDQLLKATWGDADMRSTQGCAEMDEDTQRKTCYEATRLIHYYNGFGLYHADNDHVFVFSNREERAALAEKHPPKR